MHNIKINNSSKNVKCVAKLFLGFVKKKGRVENFTGLSQLLDTFILVLKKTTEKIISTN